MPPGTVLGEEDLQVEQLQPVGAVEDGAELPTLAPVGASHAHAGEARQPLVEVAEQHKNDEGAVKAFARLDDAGNQLTSVLQRTERMLASADSAIRIAGPGLSDTQREALATLKETRSLVVELRGALQQGEGVDDLLRNLSDASENLARFTERLDRDPSSLFTRREPPKKIVGPSIRD